ncbi:MAG: tyrosine-type recombinase/integrase [Cyanobacteria bacterium]|jgi:integrase/recombinase XerD|nr:tyrosine-type recombinase/integrase [Cyanobacteria bacterium GSL.Bin1]
MSESAIQLGETTAIEGVTEAVFAEEETGEWKLTQEAITRWLNSRRKDSTRGTYEVSIKQFLAYAQKPLETILPTDIEEWLWHLEQKYKMNTVKGKLSAVKSFFSFAVRRGYLPTNVGAMVEGSRKPKDNLAEKILTREECLAIINAGKEGRDRAILKFLYATGVRVSELCGLRWRDLSPNGGGGQATIYGKGDKTRVVLIPRSIWLEIAELPRRNEFVFTNRYKGTLSRISVHKLIKEAVRKSGVDKPVSAHWFRHSHATLAIEGGCDLHLLQQSLGHSSLEITSKYLHARPNQGSSQFLGL